MLAMGFETDIAQQYDFVVTACLLEGTLQSFARILTVAGEPLLVGANYARRRAVEPLAVRFVAGQADQGAHRLFGFRA